MDQALVLRDVPADSVEDVVKKYKEMDTKIEIIKQGDGRYTLRLTVAPTSEKY